MFDFLLALLPSDVSLAIALLLIVTSFVTSATTAAFGLGGGSALIAVMTIFMPPAIVVPVHGAVQLGSNGGRAFLRRAYVQWHFAGWFILGSAIGAALGGQVAQYLPEHIFRAAIAFFILYSVWAPKAVVSANGKASYIGYGAFTSAIGMIVGISGPLVMAFLKHLKDRREIVGTHALLMTSQNLFKLLTFIAMGFAFHEYAALIVAMIVTGFIGTSLGGLLLDRLPEVAFRWIFRIILTIIALDLLRRAFFAA